MRTRALLLLLLCAAILRPSPSVAQRALPAAVSTTVGVLGGAFSAVAVVNDAPGAEVIAAGEGAALSIFALQSDGSLVRVARLELPGLVRDVEVVGGTAFVAADVAGLVVVDMSDKAAPRVLASMPMDAGSLRVVGGIAYVVVASRILQLVDVRDPARPAALGSMLLATTMGDWIGGVDVSGGYAYVGGNQLRAVDVRDPARPTLRGSTTIFWGSTALLVAGDRAYVTRHYYRDPISGGYVDVIDLRDPDRPVVLGSYYGLGYVYGLQLRGETLVATSTKGVEQLDLRSAYDRPAITLLPLSDVAQDIALAGTYAFATTSKGLHALAGQTDGSFALLSSATAGSTPIAVVQQGSRAYLLDQSVGALSVSYALHMVDVSLVAAPKALGAVNLPRRASLAITNTLAYVVTDDGHFQVYNVGADQPVLQSDTELAGFPDAVAARGSFAYVARGGARGGIQIVDLSDPTAPTLRGQVEASDGTTSVRVAEDTAYLGGNGLHIVDVRDPDRPVLLGSLNIIGWMGDVQVGDNRVYVSVQGFNGQDTTLLAIDVSTPSQPRIVATMPLPNASYLRAIIGDTLYVATDDALLLVDAATLTPRGAFAVPGGAGGIAPLGDALLVASGAGGLRTLHVDPGAFSSVYLPLSARYVMVSCLCSCVLCALRASAVI